MFFFSKPKIIVVGASGYVGKATLASLTQRHGKTVKAFAGVRNVAKFEAMPGVTAVQADMGDKKALAKSLKGYDRVFLVVPGHEDRMQLGLNGLEAAKEAGVKFVLVLSVATSGTDSIFGKQFAPIEKRAQELGVKYAIIRLPLFIDNNYANVVSIKDHNTFYDPRNPTKLHTPVAVSDVGKAAAEILAKPARHVGKLYKLVMPAFSLNDLAASFTKELGRSVTVTTVPYDAAKQSFMGMGFPEWQTDGILELFRYIDEDNEMTNETNTGDLEKITGEKPMTVNDWVQANAAAFK